METRPQSALSTAAAPTTSPQRKPSVSTPSSPKLGRTTSVPVGPRLSPAVETATPTSPGHRSTLSTNSPNPLALLSTARSVVREGSVLSRGFILKSDYRPPLNLGSEGGVGENAGVGGGVHLQGATNFRMADFGVYGVAQPTETGLRTILSVLKCQDGVGSLGERIQGRPVVWFCTREEPVVYIGAQPFVLRDAAHPTTTFSLSDRAENIEAIEERLKADILAESARYGGVILVQDEIGGVIINTWVSTNAVRTVRELWNEVASEFSNLSYHRVPISKDQAPEQGYLDSYTSILASVPTSSSLVFNCGLGVVRTTFAMSTALIVRRKQLIDEGREDPYGIEMEEAREVSPSRMMNGMRVKRSEQALRDRSLLRLMHVLQNSQSVEYQQNALGLLSSQPQLLENLRNALLGQYDLILSLLSCLDDGNGQKSLVDAIIDQCDALVNLRESVLHHRVRHATIATKPAAELATDHRAKALAALDRYFFLITFASFVQQSDNGFTVKFSSWLRSRSEIAKMISRMRKTGHFSVFSPVHDLSAIAGGSIVKAAVASPVQVGDEFAQQIVHDRSGIILRASTILKNDQWRTADAPQETTIRGAINFRRVGTASLYALSQPTEDGIKRVLEIVKEGKEKVIWINLREEPLLYLHGSPYVLRQEAVSLRNVKSYAGISSSRLELLEDRLKSDSLSEVNTFDGRILLHTELEDGSVAPIWETIESPTNVKTLREIMDDVVKTTDVDLSYYRIPITAEKAPDFSDIREIVEIVSQLDVENSAIIVNCQLGRGRSTRALVLITLVQRWLRSNGQRHPLALPATIRSTRYSYTVINNLLRTIRSGQEIKDSVDEIITLCGAGTVGYDLLEAIEDSRQSAEEAKDDLARKEDRTQKGIQDLRAYYFLILFASFLNETKAETWRELRETSNYEKFVKDRPVFATIERELETAGLSALVPLEKSVEAGNALSDEIQDFVAHRSGSILSAFTLLKSDYFKMSLPERVEGVPNFRRAKLLFSNDATPNGTMTASMVESGPLIFGTGMPTISGLRRGLERMGAKTKQIIWTSMREEPVIYVSGGRPHVLRLFDAPLENVITTGVTADIVESMELALKRDLLNEAERNGGKILLHDEIEEADGSFTVYAKWEEVSDADILTPREVFAAMREEGFHVDYERLPVTDEQSPIPATYSRIEARVVEALSRDGGMEYGIIFNCQMGRGRTTTGMVAATLVANILFSLSVEKEESESANRKSMSWDGRASDPYLAGEYRIILQLVGVMNYGKQAKKLTDRAIDTMEGVQNLRKAVYDFKLRAEAAEGQKSIKIYSVAINYLYRYGTLIVFANYLLEKAELQLSIGFPEWYAERREISRILQQRNLD